MYCLASRPPPIGRQNRNFSAINVNVILFSYIVHVLYTEGWVCDVALIEYTLGPGKPKKGWDFGSEGTRGQWGTKGVSLRATWD